MCQATYIFFLTLFYVQPIRQSEEHKQEIKVSVQRCLQRVALTDTHGAPYFFRYDNSAEIVPLCQVGAKKFFKFFKKPTKTGG